MNDKETWEKHQKLQGRMFHLEEQQERDFREILKLKNKRIKKGKEIMGLKNEIREMYGRPKLKTNEEIAKEVNGNV